MVPFSFLVQLSIGSVYAWSTFNAPLTKQLGVVAHAASDWNLSSVVPVFSVCALTLGVCTAFLVRTRLLESGLSERCGFRVVFTVCSTVQRAGVRSATMCLLRGLLRWLALNHVITAINMIVGSSQADCCCCCCCCCAGAVGRACRAANGCDDCWLVLGWRAVGIVPRVLHAHTATAVFGVWHPRRRGLGFRLHLTRQVSKSLVTVQ